MQCDSTLSCLSLQSCSSFRLHVPAFPLAQAASRPNDHWQSSENAYTAQNQSRSRPTFGINDQASQQGSNHTPGRPCHIEQAVSLRVSAVLAIVSLGTSAFLVHDCICDLCHDWCYSQYQEEPDQSQKRAKQDFLSERVVVDEAEEDDEWAAASEASSRVPARALLVRKVTDVGSDECWDDNR